MSWKAVSCSQCNTGDFVLFWFPSTLTYMSGYSWNYFFFFVMKSEMSCITSTSSVSSSFLTRIGSKVLHVTTSVFLENKVSSRQLKSLSKPCFRQSKAFSRCLESSRFPITTRSCRCTCFIICVRNTSLPSSHSPAPPQWYYICFLLNLPLTRCSQLCFQNQVY